jgi:hypothetical protein
MRVRANLTLGIGLLLLAAPASAAPRPVTFTQDIVPLLTRYCTGCHGGAKPKGDLALDRYRDNAAAGKDRAVWQKVARMVRSREMPPEGRRRPSQAEIDLLVGWADGPTTGADCGLLKDPGRVTVRRLNRAEYNNTIRDLFGADFRPAGDFPSDDVGYGFDNIGDVLSLPPLLMEKYLAAAEKVVKAVLARPALRRRLLLPSAGKQGDEAIFAVLERYARRAYRRPVRRDEVDRLMRFIELAKKNGDNLDTGLRLALEAVLVSPQFLFRIEFDPRKPGEVRTLNEHELATRLSYFLWSSMPDDELFRLAEQGGLRKDLDGQVRRMLKDPKAGAFVENFAGQWLQFRNLRAVQPNPTQFPTFDDRLRADMRKETYLFFEWVMREDRSILDFIDCDYTFVNERLASHYGLRGVEGSQFRRVSLQGTGRGGVLTQASVLTVTSNPTRTSPVKRGKWILENFLGTPPPPPPPDAGELKDDQASVLSGSLRKRMEMHRAKPACATCHARMDPLGFGFENFDAVGRWRAKDGAFAIDPSGVLPDGKTFRGPKELRAILLGRKDEFTRCLTEKMLTYALGRGVEDHDRCAVDEIARAVAGKEYQFSALVLGIVHSDPFQKRRRPGGAP